MPTPNGVNYLLQFLIDVLKLAISNNKNLKVDVHPICPYYISLSP